MTKIQVTGGAGFLGSATIAELQKHGHDIYVIGLILWE
jgi:nucleoside-diphosphate-sugar epimerase